MKNSDHVDTFVYQEWEVKMTGRTAERQTNTARTTRRPGAQVRTQQETLVEITPVNIEDGSWKKWVKPSDLYKVTTNNDNN